MPFNEAKADFAIRFFEALTLSDGEWAGQTLTLIPWQRELIWRVFGTVKEDGFRQYETVYVEIPKKNGKSGIAAGFALKLLVADGENGPEVYGAAVDRKQASIVYDDAAKFVKQSKVLRKHLKLQESTKRIQLRKGGKYEVVSSEVNSKHGIKPSGLIFDEIHALRKRKLWDILTKGSTATRRQPLILVITTAGEDQDSIAWELHQRAVAKLKAMKELGLNPGDQGEPDPTFLPVIYGATEEDDWESEEVWLRVNPSIGHTIRLETVRQEYHAAKGKPIDEAYFKQLRLNMWGTPTVEKWLPVTVWDQTKDIPVKEADLIGRKSFGGLDLSESNDLTGWVQVFPCDDDPEAVMVLPRLWVPSGRLQDQHNPNRQRYIEWAEKGYVIPTMRPAIDLATIRQQVVADAKAFKLQWLNMDKLFQGNETMTILQAEGLKAAPFQQGFITYGPVMKEFERLLREGKIRHGGHPALRWMFENLKVQRDPTGNLKPDKIKSNAKIDGMVALIMALEGWMRWRASLQKPKSNLVNRGWNGKR